jgi:hypothetical protein
VRGCAARRPHRPQPPKKSWNPSYTQDRGVRSSSKVWRSTKPVISGRTLMWQSGLAFRMRSQAGWVVCCPALGAHVNSCMLLLQLKPLADRVQCMKLLDTVAWHASAVALPQAYAARCTGSPYQASGPCLAGPTPPDWRGAQGAESPEQPATQHSARQTAARD